MTLQVAAGVLVILLAPNVWAVRVTGPVTERIVASWAAAEIAERRQLSVEVFTPVPAETVEDTSEPEAPVVTVPPYMDNSVYPWTGDPRIEQWRNLAEIHFSPGDVERALGIIRCESVGDPLAINPTSGTAGLFQHHPRYWPERSEKALGRIGDPHDPGDAFVVASWLVYHNGGWGHWAGYEWNAQYWPGCLDWVIEQGA